MSVYFLGYAGPIGILYTIPVNAAYAYFPLHKGTVGGIVLAGFTMGTFVFGFISNAVINPNKVTTLELSHDQTINYRITQFYWIQASFCLIAFLLALIFIEFPKNVNAEKEDNKKEDEKVIIELQIESDSKNQECVITCATESNQQIIEQPVVEQTYNTGQIIQCDKSNTTTIEKYECQSFRQAFRSVLFYQFLFIPFFQGCKLIIN